MAITSMDDKETLRSVKIALKNIVRPWEILCGLIDVGPAFIPDVYAKTPKDYEDHLGDYMDRPTPVINKKTGEVKFMDWDDDDLNESINTGKYIRIQNIPEYAR